MSIASGLKNAVFSVSPWCPSEFHHGDTENTDLGRVLAASLDY